MLNPDLKANMNNPDNIPSQSFNINSSASSLGQGDFLISAPGPKKSKKRLWIVIMSFVVVLVLSATAIYIIFIKNDEKNTVKNSPQELKKTTTVSSEVLLTVSLEHPPRIGGINFPLFSDDKKGYAYVSNDEKWLITDKGSYGPYESVRKPQITNGEISYIFRKDGKDRFMFGGKESFPYDEITNPVISKDGKHYAFIGIEKYEDNPGQQYFYHLVSDYGTRGSYKSISTPIFNLDGKLAFGGAEGITHKGSIIDFTGEQVLEGVSDVILNQDQKNFAFVYPINSPYGTTSLFFNNKEILRDKDIIWISPNFDDAGVRAYTTISHTIVNGITFDQPGFFAISPNGNDVLFKYIGNYPNDIILYLNDKKLELGEDNNSSIGEFGFTPSGEVFYVQNLHDPDDDPDNPKNPWGISRLSIGGKNIAEEKGTISNVTFSNDGSKYAYVNSYLAVESADFAGNTKRRAKVVVNGVPGPEFWIIDYIVFSKSGNHVAYVVNAVNNEFRKNGSNDFPIKAANDELVSAVVVDGEISEYFDWMPFYSSGTDNFAGVTKNIYDINFSDDENTLTYIVGKGVDVLKVVVNVR